MTSSRVLRLHFIVPCWCLTFACSGNTDAVRGYGDADSGAEPTGQRQYGGGAGAASQALRGGRAGTQQVYGGGTSNGGRMNPAGAGSITVGSGGTLNAPGGASAIGAFGGGQGTLGGATAIGGTWGGTSGSSGQLPDGKGAAETNSGGSRPKGSTVVGTGGAVSSGGTAPQTTGGTLATGGQSLSATGGSAIGSGGTNATGGLTGGGGVAAGGGSNDSGGTSAAGSAVSGGSSAGGVENGGGTSNGGVAGSATAAGGAAGTGACVDASCECPPVPAQCVISSIFASGAFCATNRLVQTCGFDQNGCPAILRETTCDSPLKCGGVFPFATCICPSESSC